MGVRAPSGLKVGNWVDVAHAMNNYRPSDAVTPLPLPKPVDEHEAIWVLRPREVAQWLGLYGDLTYVSQMLLRGYQLDAAWEPTRWRLRVTPGYVLTQFMILAGEIAAERQRAYDRLATAVEQRMSLEGPEYWGVLWERRQRVLARRWRKVQRRWEFAWF